jgi:hypothetical protein
VPANAGYEGEAHCAAIWLFALQHSADHRLCPYAAIDAGVGHEMGCDCPEY